MLYPNPAIFSLSVRTVVDLYPPKQHDFLLPLRGSVPEGCPAAAPPSAKVPRCGERPAADRDVSEEEPMEELGESGHGPGYGLASAAASPSLYPPRPGPAAAPRWGPGRGAPTRRGGTAALRPGHAPAALPAGRLGRASLGTAFGGGRGSVARQPRRGGAGGGVTAGAARPCR